MVLTKSNPIKHHQLDDDYDRVPVLDSMSVDGSQIVSAFKQFREHDDNEIVLIDDDHEVIRVEPSGDYCSECNDNETPEIERGMPAKAAQHERRKSECKHAAVANDLPHTTQCDCGSWVMVQRGPVTERIGPTTHCAECDELQ
jgi:hypothetical protein